MKLPTLGHHLAVASIKGLSPELSLGAAKQALQEADHSCWAATAWISFGLSLIGGQMRIAILFVLCVALTGCTVQFNPGAGTQTPARGGTDAEQAAVRVAASAVLALLDAEQWDKVWSGAGTSLAQTSSQSDFATGVRTAHTLFGAPKSRAITGYAFPESLEGAPPGQYGIVFYATDFSKFDGVEEQVVLVHERGEWRLAGYWAEKHKKLKLL